MKKCAVVFLFALSGCGGGDYSEQSYDPTSDNHGYGWHYDRETTGLKLRYKPTLQDDSPIADPEFYTRQHDQVQQCTGLTGSVVPFVIIEPDGGFGTRSFERYDPPLMVIHAPRILTVALVAAVVRHGVIHLLLEQTTGDPDPDHRSPLFEKCMF